MLTRCALTGHFSLTEVSSLFVKTIEHDGEMCSTAPSHNGHKTRIRSLVAMSLLKLETGNQLRSHDLHRRVTALSMIVQDPCYEVRSLFLKKIVKYLKSCSINVNYISLLYLAVFEPEEELKSMVKLCISYLLRFLRKCNLSFFVNYYLLGSES
jgi:hypothetical protein